MLGDLMANHVWTRMTINSDDLSVHEHIGEWFTPDMPSWDKEAVRNAVEPIFGEYEEDDDYPIEEVGSKWVVVEDYWQGSDESEITFTSAWSFPDGYVKKLLEKLLEIDEDVEIEFTVDEESDDFLIGGYGSKMGYTTHEEDSPERPDESDCESDGLNYEDEVEEFYEKCNEIKNELMESSKLEVRGNQL